MLGFNKILIIGVLGHDPEIRYTRSGMAITTLNVAIYDKKNNGDTWENSTDWFNVVCLGKSAENIGKFLKKGRQIFVDGKLQNRLWTNKQGQKSLITEIIAKQVIFLGKQDFLDQNTNLNNNDSKDVPF
jgi:single-strand DNA-binding protein